jgi:hypothetical protein
VAEDDTLLYESRVETSAFQDLYSDKVDIILGTKGSGKSSLYRIFAEYMADPLFAQRRIAIIRGAEMKGDPVFAKFRPQFDSLTESDFENFWRIYIISLVTSQFLASTRYGQSIAANRFKRFKAAARAKGFPIKDSQFSIETLIAWGLAQLNRIKKVEAGLTPEAPRLAVEFHDRRSGAEQAAASPIFVAELHDLLVDALESADISLWIMLDRLDEAFPRRSSMERTALRALLRTTLAFKSPRLRLKVFLRDDIFESVTETTEGFVALTHIRSRCSNVLRWDKEQLLHLISNRIFTQSSTLARTFRLDMRRLQSDPRYRRECFYHIFPKCVRAQSSTLDWIYKHCEDANGVVTPRDVIDLIKAAKARQWDQIHTHGSTEESVLSAAAILQGHAEMSARKCTDYLKAEFSHFGSAISRFQNQKAEYDELSLRTVLGDDWCFLKDLCSIGFLQENPAKRTHSIPFLYRPGLKIRQGKSRGNVTRSS